MAAEDMIVFGAPSNDSLPPVTVLRDLSKLPLILTSPPDMARLIMENAASGGNIHLNVRFEVESLQVMKDLVARSMGTASCRASDFTTKPDHSRRQ
jgi:hypothetical protein